MNNSIITRFASSFTPTERTGSASVAGNIGGTEACLSIYSELDVVGGGPVEARVRVKLTYGTFHYVDVVDGETAKWVYTFIRESIDAVMTAEHDARRGDEQAFKALFAR